ncbi:MAG: ATP-binding protein [Bacteroidales bacterium]|nr:ATP-binding protein [Bacteroidales bacterium]
MIKRTITKQLIADIKQGHVTALFGARRTGKTTLMNVIIKNFSDRKVLILNGEDYDVANVLSSLRQETLKNLVSGFEFLFIDEAQNIPKIGQNLKLLVDTNPDIAVFVTGSASFDLRNKIGEPLTGRSRFFTLYPFSLGEISSGYLNAIQRFPEFLVYGSYPQLVLTTNIKEKRFLLENIRNGYLLKDILQMENVKDSLFVMNLLKLIAFQIGNDVSYNELAKNLSTTVKTVQRYLDILEKAFVIFRLQGFSKNLRKEISKSPRFYFWDNGIRNAVISNFNTPDLRDDMGKLWENYCISERIKKQVYLETFSNFYFWRTYDQQEIDLIEITDNNINAFEFKWGEKNAKAPKAFSDNYPEAKFYTINRLSFFDFLK